MELGSSTSALYIDFDNFFGGLIAVDPQAALDVAQSPARWVERLRTSYSPGGRRWLILRCYMNPAGWVPHPKNAGERLYFSKFRPFFTQAGFEIVDCPSLTRNAKNGADIRMTIDIMTALRATTRYDEIAIASSDSDFTHLLQVVRADDRRIMMIATSGTAAAYQALADTYLDEQDMLDLMREDVDVDEPVEVEMASTAASSLPTPVDWEAFADDVRLTYATALEPLNLARWSTSLIRRFGHGLVEGRWFGTGAFAKALDRVGLEQLEVSQHFAWNSGQHVAPEDPTVAPRQGLPVDVATSVSLPADIARFREIVQLPRISSDRWPVIFQSLEAYAALHEFQLAESTRWSRDHAAEQGIDIPRSAFNYVVRSCVIAGSPLNSDPPPTAERIGEALLTSVLDGASRAGLEVTDDERSSLRTWLQLSGPE